MSRLGVASRIWVIPGNETEVRTAFSDERSSIAWKVTLDPIAMIYRIGAAKGTLWHTLASSVSAVDDELHSRPQMAVLGRSRLNDIELACHSVSLRLLGESVEAQSIP